jgi:hypothetical protein
MPNVQLFRGSLSNQAIEIEGVESVISSERNAQASIILLEQQEVLYLKTGICPILSNPLPIMIKRVDS